MKGFASSQIKKLVRPLDPQRIQTREVQGQALRYIEGWFAIQQANAIFGYAGWDREMVHFERLYERPKGNATACAYAVRIRIRVRAGEDVVIREGTGFGTACENDLAEAHERALKAAETDATKRALSTFGSRFGLSLYEKERHDGQQVRFALRGADGVLIAQSLSPEAFCSGLRQLVDACSDTNTLLSLRVHNQTTMENLHRQAPELRSPRGMHYADILESLIAKRLLAFDVAPPNETIAAKTSVELNVSAPTTAEIGSEDGKRASANNNSSTGTDDRASQKLPLPTTRPSRIGQGSAIEKSQLQIGNDRRVRNKAHLALVAGKPCLICEDFPCHAHHVTFAQRRGLSQKVSDEFTVPLCAQHHNAVHLSGSERAWWRAQGIEPLETAAQLWTETSANSQISPR